MITNSRNPFDFFSENVDGEAVMLYLHAKIHVLCVWRGNARLLHEVNLIREDLRTVLAPYNSLS